MSKRFGRNQRRELKARLAMAEKTAIQNIRDLIIEKQHHRNALNAKEHLKAQLVENEAVIMKLTELMADMPMADGSEILKIPFALVSSWIDTTEFDRSSGRIVAQRTASVRIDMGPHTQGLVDAIYNLHRNNLSCSFSGFRWWLRNVNLHEDCDGSPNFIDSHRRSGIHAGRNSITINLIATGRMKR